MHLTLAARCAYKSFSLSHCYIDSTCYSIMKRQCSQAKDGYGEAKGKHCIQKQPASMALVAARSESPSWHRIAFMRERGLIDCRLSRPLLVAGGKMIHFQAEMCRVAQRRSKIW